MYRRCRKLIDIYLDAAGQLVGESPSNPLSLDVGCSAAYYSQPFCLKYSTGSTPVQIISPIASG